MSVGTLDRSSPSPLLQLVDGISLRTGAWVVVESFGTVVAHGAGRSPCPPAMAQTVLGKSTAPLRASVTWLRGGAGLQGWLNEATVHATELGDGVTAWSLDAPMSEADLAELRLAVRQDTAPVTDSMLEGLLNPLGPSRAGRAPTALLLALRSSAPVGVLGRAALAAVAGVAGRVHTHGDTVVVALPTDTDAGQVAAAARVRCPDLTAGVAEVHPGASDWSAAATVATGCLRAATRLGLTVAGADDAAVAAELVVEEAQAAAEALTAHVRSPLQRLREHDNRSNSELVRTLTAWCRAGFDVAEAASALHVHANTLRYRLRRAGDISGLDLDRPRHVLALQLLLGV